MEPAATETPRRSPVSLRAVLLGLAGVTVICGLTPYNDYAVNNTFLVGNNLPLGVVLLLFLFLLCVNGPLSRWWPRHAFTSGEIAVAFAMTLVSSALPSSGLMRYFPPTLVSPLWHARSSGEYRQLLESLALPEWIFPSFQGDDASQWINDPVVTGYLGRSTAEEPIPYLAWLRPALTWGIFIFALYGALLCMVVIVRRQWYENERLAFPLAQIQLALVEAPPAGRWFNGILARRTFWVAFFAVFGLHLWNGLARYHPDYFPEIWVYYNFGWEIFTEPPLSYVDTKIKDAAIFFTAVGVTYFMTTPVAFSLWFFYVLHSVYRMWLGMRTGDPTVYQIDDWHVGAVLAFFLATVWVGRNHWKLVVTQAFRGERDDEPRGRYLSYPLAFWGFVGCTVVMIGWLVAAGSSLLGATVTVLMLLTLFLVITRVIAETGLVHGQLRVALYQPWVWAVMAGWTRPIPLEGFYLTSMLQATHYDYREVVPVYATHGLKVTDQTAFGGRETTADVRQDRRLGRRVLGTLALALVVGYVVSFGSTLWTEYHYGWTMSQPPTIPINEWGAELNPKYQVLDATVRYGQANYPVRHNVPAAVGFGFGFTALLAFLRLRYTVWPLHPVGFLMLGTYPGAHLWFSIFIGWVCKVLIVRFGGTKLYLAGRPLFIGLIAGESIAAAFWLVTAIVLNWLGYEYRAIPIMPG